MGMFILCLILFSVIRARWTETSDKIKNLSPIGFLALVVVIFAGLVLLFIYVTKMDGTLGTPGNPDAVNEEVGDSLTEDAPEVQAEDTIILHGEEIIIHDKTVNMEEAYAFIDGYIGSDKELTIVDDYSSAELHHAITDRCDERYVRYRKVDEKGNEQK